MASPARAFALIIALAIAVGIVGLAVMQTPPTLRLRHEENVVYVKSACIEGTPNTKTSDTGYGLVTTGPNCLPGRKLPEVE